MLLPFTSQAEPLTERFIVELQQDAGFPNQSFSIKTDRRLLSVNPSVIAYINGDAGPDLPPYYKRQKNISYEVITPLIESIYWQLLYSTNLLVAFELIFTTRDTSPNPAPYSWLPVETVVAVGWLLKSYWTPDSPPLNLVQQQEISQDHPFVITAMMPGSEHNQQQDQPSGSSDQPPETPFNPLSYFIRLFYFSSGEGNGDPQQQSHTLGLDCFVHPCNGVCIFRPPSESLASPAGSEPGQNSCPHLTNNHCYRCIRHSDPEIETSNPPLAIQLQSASGQQSHIYTINNRPANRCNVIVLNSDGHLQPCGKVYKTAQSLSEHKRGIHSKQQTCEVTVVGEDGQRRPCGLVCRNSRALSSHKLRHHTEQPVCDITVVTKDGQQRPCGMVCKNPKAFWDHKRRLHTGKKACDAIVVGKDGRPRPCGRVCKNISSLSDHKGRQHSGQKACDVNMVTENGQQQPCGKICKSAGALSEHKKRNHNRPRICDEHIVGEDPESQPCGKIFISAQALWFHKRKDHTGEQTCNSTMVAKDGQQRRCGKVYRNIKSLSEHKSRYHQKRKLVDLEQHDDLSPPKGKASNDL
ncbi:hypothetical protein [Endozoicomonas sp. 8E]|uniref:hypothetical protein n=1 Tax=Endozoicomonas sp. 8E TaxID=3035692 RepID=UPI002938D3D5|nr:hypothetical protein [Endozoicomonas sp. 8E]WOG26970.1 hypothetical protein P6910_20830 [Endozoicomonas sp. 8E]